MLVAVFVLTLSRSKNLFRQKNFQNEQWTKPNFSFKYFSFFLTENMLRLLRLFVSYFSFLYFILCVVAFLVVCSFFLETNTKRKKNLWFRFSPCHTVFLNKLFMLFQLRFFFIFSLKQNTNFFFLTLNFPFEHFLSAWKFNFKFCVCDSAFLCWFIPHSFSWVCVPWHW